jgi:hypothetical protein
MLVFPSRTQRSPLEGNLAAPEGPPSAVAPQRALLPENGGYKKGTPI